MVLYKCERPGAPLTRAFAFIAVFYYNDSVVSIEFALLILAVLILLSILASKISDRVGVPALLLFLAIGMLAGSDGLGGIYFDNVALAQYIGVIALALILFSGGLDTDLESIRPVLRAGLSLSIICGPITALLVGVAAYYLLEFSLLEGLLLGAIVCSTDAAAVFSILRTRGVSLKGGLKPLLELESGSNDPIAVILTVSLVTLLTQPDYSPLQMFGSLVRQLAIGTLVGFGVGRLSVFLINRIKLFYDGLYPVVTLAIVFLTYGLAGYLGGSGFLAVYLAGLILGNAEFIHRRSILRFFDGLAWLMQIAMFLTLGLLVFPSQLPAVALDGLLIAAILMFIARPLGVYISLLFSRFRFAEKTFVAWVGLRGAAPIVLATFPLLAGVENANGLFNLVFFVVLTSVLLQGPSIPFVARALSVDAPPLPRQIFPLEPNPVEGFRSQLKEMAIPAGSPFEGKAIVELGLPEKFLIILIARENDFLIPSGATILQPGDTLLVISDRDDFQSVEARVKT
jgi:cell volume regulation protein A